MMRTVLQCVAVCWLVILAGCAARQVVSEGDSIQYVETDTGRLPGRTSRQNREPANSNTLQNRPHHNHSFLILFLSNHRLTARQEGQPMVLLYTETIDKTKNIFPAGTSRPQAPLTWATRRVGPTFSALFQQPHIDPCRKTLLHLLLRAVKFVLHARHRSASAYLFIYRLLSLIDEEVQC